MWVGGGGNSSRERGSRWTKQYDKTLVNLEIVVKEQQGSKRKAEAVRDDRRLVDERIDRQVDGLQRD